MSDISDEAEAEFFAAVGDGIICLHGLKPKECKDHLCLIDYFYMKRLKHNVKGGK